MQHLIFDNQLVRELPGDTEHSPRRRQVEHAAWSHAPATPVSAPRLIAHSQEVAQWLGLSAQDVASPRFAAVFSGNELLPGMQPVATCYGGHQFGHWAGQLGDGRAISLGEVLPSGGGRAELQLKGAGPTPYSRTADGRAVLRSSIREFLCSEAMHHLGVPTTRALCIVATGERVVRDVLYDGHPAYEPAAIVCRVAPSFTRFGHFELPSMRGDRALLQQWVDFTIARDFPELEGDQSSRRAQWFSQVCLRTARMVAHWMRVGFVHGVMNTDNMSVLGLTLDYGPYGWIDNFDPDWTPNTTDAAGRRYRFGQQAEIAHWNLVCLGRALAPLFDALEPLQAGLELYAATFAREQRDMTAAKFGFASLDDDQTIELVESAFGLLQEAELDMTLFFRGLAKVELQAAAIEPLHAAFYSEASRAQHGPALQSWLRRYAACVQQQVGVSDAQRPARMNAVNPCYVLRNYLAQEAIDQAEQGDESLIATLLEVLRHPYDERPEHARFGAKRPEWARHKVGCSMLSCSS